MNKRTKFSLYRILLEVCKYTKGCGGVKRSTFVEPKEERNSIYIPI